MPNIGGKKFPYTPAGRRAASRYARGTGQQMGNQGGYGIQRPGMRGNPGMRGSAGSPMMSNLRSPAMQRRRGGKNPLAMLNMLRRRNIV